MKLKNITKEEREKAIKAELYSLFRSHKRALVEALEMVKRRGGIEDFGNVVTDEITKAFDVQIEAVTDHEAVAAAALKKQEAEKERLAGLAALREKNKLRVRVDGAVRP